MSIRPTPFKQQDHGSVLNTIVDYLEPEELGKSALVNRQWKRLTDAALSRYTLDGFKRAYPGFNVIGTDFWAPYAAAYGIDATDEPLDTRTLRERALAVSRMSMHVEGGLGVTLLTMPKGLTFNKLIQFARDENVPIAYVWPSIFEILGNRGVTATQIAVITNSIFQGSRNSSVTAQQALVKGMGCEMPDMLTVATLAIATYKNSPVGVPPTRLYPDGDPNWTFTRCKETIEGWHLVVGGFAPSGLRVADDDDDNDFFGVGGQRKF